MKKTNNANAYKNLYTDSCIYKFYNTSSIIFINSHTFFFFTHFELFILNVLLQKIQIILSHSFHY